jgi:SAM-dependent methyltransferase
MPKDVTAPTPGCCICGSRHLETVLDLGAMPVAHRLLSARREAEECFPFVLDVCPGCGVAQIREPIEPEHLYRGFNYNFSSWKNEPHLDDEIDAIVQRVRPQSVLEIGCNDGRFLQLLHARGCGVTVGLEPNPAPGGVARERGLDVYEGWASPELVKAIVAERGAFDLVVCRQVLEHVADPNKLLRAARAALVPGGYFFVDVPDWQPARALGDISVLWEEHVKYYTAATLLPLLSREGFVREWSSTYDFSGMTVAVLARLMPGGEQTIAAASLARELEAARRYPQLVENYGTRLRRALAKAQAGGVRTVLYGVGVRACSSVNGLRLGAYFDCVLDDQPERQGKCMPGTRLPIVAPESLAGAREPLLCALAVNNENEAAVRAKLDAIVGKPARYVTLCGPADIWADLERLENAWAA